MKRYDMKAIPWDSYSADVRPVENENGEWILYSERLTKEERTKLDRFDQMLAQITELAKDPLDSYTSETDE